MDSPMTVKKKEALTREAFDLLLASLDADREQAGRKYEHIRHKLVKYFEWRGAALPDAQVDETINRVALKIASGVDVHNLDAYFYGVARLIFIESLRAREKEQEALKQTAAAGPQTADEDSGAAERLACLDRCLQRLPAENRDLIIEYYQEEKGGKIERRKRLASRLGVPLNALRIRAHRIRVGLEVCVRECMAQYA